MNKAVFLDRDGTIIEEVNYLRQIDQIDIFKCSAPAISLLNKANFKVVVITNQSGVARGYFKEDFVKKSNSEIANRLRMQGANIDAWFYCPHHPTEGEAPYKIDCNCRKPKIGLIAKAKDMFDIDLSSSFIIGDSLKDLEAGWNAGLKTILVLTGHGKNTLKSLRKDQYKDVNFIAEDILEASKWILDFLKNPHLKRF